MDAVVAESGRNPVSKNKFQPENERTDAGRRETKFSGGANRDREKIMFSVQLITTTRIGNHNKYQVDPCMPPILSICPCMPTSSLHSSVIPIIINSDCGKSEAHVNWFMVTCKGSTRCYWNYLEDYWPWAGGLSAVNAIDTRLSGNPMNLGLARWCSAV